MLWLFGQTWIWILIAFILGLIIGYLISWLFGKKKQAEVTEERVAAPAATPARERSLDDDIKADADVEAPSVDADAEKPAMSMIDDKDSSIDAGDAAAEAPSVDGAVDGGLQEAAYGPASALPLAGGAAPSAEFTVKGNEDSMLFHTTDSPYYSRTKAEVWFKTPADAEAAGFTAWNKPKSGAGAPEAATAPVIEPGAYAGSAKPLAGGAAPSAEYTVKGNEDSMLFHTPESAFYEHTTAEVWFKTPAEAQAAGFTAWNELRRTDAPASASASASAAPAAAAAGAVGGGTVMGGSAVDTEPDTGRIPVQSPETATAPPSTDGQTASPYGSGSALPLSGGAAPSAEYTVKGNADSMLYHTTESPYFPRTVAEVWFKTPAEAEAAGFTAWNKRRGQEAVAAPTWEPGAYPNSAQPLADGAAPAEEFTVKGNEDSMLFHTTESPYYPRTRAEVWFRTAADAEAAGFTAWNRRR